MERKIAVFNDIQDPIVYMNLRSIVDKLNDHAKRFDAIEELLAKQSFEIGRLSKEVETCMVKLRIAGSAKEGSS